MRAQRIDHIHIVLTRAVVGLWPVSLVERWKAEKPQSHANSKKGCVIAYLEVRMGRHVGWIGGMMQAWTDGVKESIDEEEDCKCYKALWRRIGYRNRGMRMRLPPKPQT